MPWSERKMLETWMGMNTVVLCVSISNAKVKFKCTFNLIKERTKHTIASRSQMQIKQYFQIVSGSRGWHKLNEVCVPRWQILYFLCCLAVYNRVAAPLNWPAVKYTWFTIFCWLFSQLRHLNHLDAMHGWHEASPAVVPSSWIAVSSCLWRRKN